MLGDYQLVNHQGQVVYDSASEAMKRQLREGEPFTANTDCPKCGAIDVHWLDTPRLRPAEPTPLDMMNESVRRMSQVFSPDPPRLYDPPGTAVARICTSCGWRWGQR